MGRQCPECGADFTPHNGRMRFCSVRHRQQFERRNAVRGQMLTGLVQAWAAGRHGDADLRRFARRAMSELASAYNQEDREAGRLPLLPVQERMDLKWRPGDKSRAL